jgi:hypothetical protein
LAIRHKNSYGPITLDDSSLFALVKNPGGSILLENQFPIEARFSINIGLSIAISEWTNSQLRVMRSKSQDDSKSGDILNETIECGRRFLNGRSPPWGYLRWTESLLNFDQHFRFTFVCK